MISHDTAFGFPTWSTVDQYSARPWSSDHYLEVKMNTRRHFELESEHWELECDGEAAKVFYESLDTIFAAVPEVYRDEVAMVFRVSRQPEFSDVIDKWQRDHGYHKVDREVEDDDEGAILYGPGQLHPGGQTLNREEDGWLVA